MYVNSDINCLKGLTNDLFVWSLLFVNNYVYSTFDY